MKRLLQAILISILIGASPPNAPAKPQNFEIGVNVHLDHYPKIARAAELGATWVRIDINWDGVEPQQGVWDFSAPDQSVQDACEQGLKIYATLAYSPAWASSEGKNISVPDPAAWAEFVTTVAKRYCGQIDAYGIWNEPNLEEFWSGSAAEYVNVLLKPASAAIRQNAPGTLVAGPELAHLYSARLGIQNFLNTFSRLGGADCIDILSHHVYGDGDFYQKIHGFRFLGIRYKPGLEQMLRRAGLNHKEVWITEMGADAKSLGENSQAALLAKQIKILKREAWVTKAFIYQLGDDSDPGPNWGMLRSDQSLRQAYFRVRQLVKN